MNNIFEQEMSKLRMVEKSYLHEINVLEKEYSEYMFEHVNVLYESEKLPFYTRVKNFFVKLIKDVELYIKTLGVNIDTIIQKKNLTRRLKELKETLSKENPNKTVEMIDAFKLKSFITDSYKELSKMCDKFSKIKYKDAFDIDRDMDIFNNKIEKFNNKLKEFDDKKIKVKISEALEFVNNELSHRTDITKYMVESVSKIKEMQLVAENLQKKVDYFGQGIIPKHTNFIQRMSLSLATYIKKGVSQFIFTVVFLFA